MRQLFARSLVLLAVILVAACGGSEGGGGGVQSAVLSSATADFDVCFDTLDTVLLTAGSASGRVGDLEQNAGGFTAGECRALLLFPVSGATDSIPVETLLDSIRLTFTITGSVGTAPAGNMILEPIAYDGMPGNGFGATAAHDGVSFPPSAGPWVVVADSLDLLPTVGAAGYYTYRLRMVVPAALDGDSDAWLIAMREGAPATLAFYWTD